MFSFPKLATSKQELSVSELMYLQQLLYINYIYYEIHMAWAFFYCLLEDNRASPGYAIAWEVTVVLKFV